MKSPLLLAPALALVIAACGGHGNHRIVYSGTIQGLWSDCTTDHAPICAKGDAELRREGARVVYRP